MIKSKEKRTYDGTDSKLREHRKFLTFLTTSSGFFLLEAPTRGITFPFPTQKSVFNMTS